MTGAELKQFYEKLYFHEIDIRDKIHGRLQLPLTLLLVIGGAVLFFFQNFEYQTADWTPLRLGFVGLVSCGCMTMVVALTWFVKALRTDGYYFLPDTRTTAQYKRLLEETYRNYDDQRELVSDALDKYLTDYYVEYAAFNTNVNDRRSASIHLCNVALIAAGVLFLLAYLIFYFGNLDRSKMKPPLEISISKPVDVRVQRDAK